MNTDEALYVNLKVLSKLQPYQRLNTRQSLFQVTHVEANNRFTEYLTHMPEWLKRWMEGSSRDSDFNRIRDLVYKAFHTMKQEKERSKIIDHLQKASVGLNNLKKTYENDLTYTCRITTLIDNIKEHVGQYNVEAVLEDDFFK
jgi:hypothetical protein